MRRFWDTKNESESETESEHEIMEQQETVDMTKLYDIESSSEEEEKRVVRSEREKRFSELKDAVHTMQNHMKINDWNCICKDFDFLQRLLLKARSVVAKEGIPPFFFKAIVGLEVFASEKTQDKKKMSKTNAKSFSKTQQKLKKFRREHSEALTKYEENPLLSEDEEEEKESSEEEEPVNVEEEEEEEEEEDEEEEEEEWSTEEEEEDEESDADIEMVGITRDFWVKKPEEEEEKRKKKAALKPRRKRVQKARKKRVKKREEKKDETEWTPQRVRTELAELMAQRGKRGDRSKIVTSLRLLLTHCGHAGVRLKVLMALATALFEVALNRMEYMPVESWTSCVDCVNEVLDLLDANSHVELLEGKGEESLDWEQLEEAAKLNKQGETAPLVLEEKEKEKEEVKAVKIRGNLFSLVFRLADELRKSLTTLNQFTLEYVKRLGDEQTLVSLIKRCAAHYKQKGSQENYYRLLLMQLELTYYQYHPEADVQLSLFKHVLENKDVDVEPSELQDAPRDIDFHKPHFGPITLQSIKEDHSPIHELVTELFKHDARSKMRALLCHVYYCAVHNKFTAARELLLMSRVQDAVNAADISTRILFNRTVAQLGVCAFRTGHFDETLHCLTDLYNTNKVKELLAQGITQMRWHDRDAEKEAKEKQRKYPWHMHINLDMLESTLMLSAMFAEVPFMATNDRTDKRHVIHRNFRRHFDHFVQQAFNGPPENTRDTIMAATCALLVGDWMKAWELVEGLRMWEHMANAELVQALVRRQVKKVALRAYLLKFALQYESLSSDHLCSMFKLPQDVVFRIASQMMVDGELAGAWDEPTGCIIMSSTLPSTLQNTALHFAEKVALLIDQNERLLAEQHRTFYGATRRKFDRKTTVKKGAWR